MKQYIMKQYTETKALQKKAVLVSLATAKQPLIKAKEYLAELALLVNTLHIEVLETFIQHLEKPIAKTLIGAGKVLEIKDFAQSNQVDQIIFDDELTPSQTRNLEILFEKPVVDRNTIILEIFAMRAQTKQAKTQVELAQYQYLLPRLRKMWTHLSRQQGGVSGMRGPGEKELETDRRIVQEKIALLRKKLEDIAKQSITERKNRDQLVRIALVGYTNVGKSTLMHLLTKEDTYVEDKLFATIKSTVRRIFINEIPCLLTDTVGFIRKLPHTLIEAFKSTLDEIREADVLLHVIDATHPACDEQIAVVQQTLHEIGATQIPTIFVLNKIDQYQYSINEQQHHATTFTMLNDQLKKKYEIQYSNPVVCIAAKTAQNITELKILLYQQVLKKHQQIYPNYLKKEIE